MLALDDEDKVAYTFISIVLGVFISDKLASFLLCKTVDKFIFTYHLRPYHQVNGLRV